jgi:hypothetical protein
VDGVKRLVRPNDDTAPGNAEGGAKSERDILELPYFGRPHLPQAGGWMRFSAFHMTRRCSNDGSQIWRQTVVQTPRSSPVNSSEFASMKRAQSR